MGVEGRVGGLKGHHQVHSPSGLRPQGKLRLEEMLDNGSVSESAGSVRVNAVAECSLRGRVRWGSQEVGFATCVVSRRKGAGREFQLGAKLAHLAEALRR